MVQSCVCESVCEIERERERERDGEGEGEGEWEHRQVCLIHIILHM